MPKRRWRDYRTTAGRRPVKYLLELLSDTDAAAVLAAMKQVAAQGNTVAHHLRGDIYEVRAARDRQSYRILYASEGRHEQVLLALEAFSKKTEKTPVGSIRLAERRLADWRARGRPW